MSTRWSTNVFQPIVIGPGKSMWWGVYPCVTVGRRSARPGRAVTARSASVSAITTSVSIGRW